MDSRDWKTLASRELLFAPPWLRVTVEEVRLPGGHVLTDFYQIALPDFVVVVAETSTGEVVTEHQYKHGIRRVSTLLPAGLVEKDEEPLAAAQRELREETGYASEEWRGLGSFVVDGNRGCGRAHVFAARGARRVGEPVVDAGEPLEVRLFERDALVRAALNGEMEGLAHVAALLLALAAGALGQP